MSETAGTPPPAAVSYLQRRLHLNHAPVTLSAEADLRGDGGRQILVYMADQSFCGSGGCVLYVLQPQGRSFRVLMSATLVQPPVRVLWSKSHGYRDIGVTVAGGGVIDAYEARLRFDGRRYPSNPSVPPAVRMRVVRGRVLISQTDVRDQFARAADQAR